MRDRAAYLAAGRKDPTTPQQMQEHPYDFVALPAQAAQAALITHERYRRGRLTGELKFIYETVTPLHVGSGVFETAADCGLEGGSRPVRGITRSLGRPVLPGASWKGAVRARFEAITRSRLGVVRTEGAEPSDKVPAVLRGGPEKHRIQIEDARVRGPLRPLGQVKGAGGAGFSPAESLFGALGYRGRIAPGEGIIEPPADAAGDPQTVAPMDSPAMHRLAKPGEARRVGASRVVIGKVEGRKFYYDGPVVTSRRAERDGRVVEAREPVDRVPCGARITVPVRIESLSLAELGALLVAAGWGEANGVLRFGGFKPAGLGKVKLMAVSGSLAEGPEVRRWKRGSGTPLDAEAAVAVARRELIDAAALAELHQITTRVRP